MKKSNDHNVEKGLLVGAGLIAAAALGYFFFGPGKDENRKRVRGWFTGVRDEIVERLAALQSVSQKEFSEIIDDVFEKYTAVKEVGEREATSMARDLKKHWKLIALEVASGNITGAKEIIKDAVFDEVVTLREEVAKEIAPKKKKRTPKTKKS